MKRVLWPCVLIALLCAVAAAGVPEGLWTPRGSEVYNLEPGESTQFRIDFDQLPVRTWILSVDGGRLPCDLNVLRLEDGALLYQQHDESVHRVRIPWGRDETVSITLTANRRAGGSYTVEFLAPPPEQAPLAYGYDLNRALEALEEGRADRARPHLRDAVVNEPRDVGVAYLLMAGLARREGKLEQAAGLFDLAMDAGLPESLSHVEDELKAQLASVRHRLDPVLIEADRLLAEGDADAAVTRIGAYLDEDEDRSGWATCEALRRLGHAHQLAGRRVPAQDCLDQALAVAADRGQTALVYYRLADLQLEHGNRDQARRAFDAARDHGLPPDLRAEVEARLAELGGD